MSSSISQTASRTHGEGSERVRIKMSNACAQGIIADSTFHQSQHQGFYGI
jgi:hypothetical protein